MTSEKKALFIAHGLRFSNWVFDNVILWCIGGYTLLLVGLLALTSTIGQGWDVQIRGNVFLSVTSIWFGGWLLLLLFSTWPWCRYKLFICNATNGKYWFLVNRKLNKSIYGGAVDEDFEKKFQSIAYLRDYASKMTIIGRGAGLNIGGQLYTSELEFDVQLDDDLFFMQFEMGHNAKRLSLFDLRVELMAHIDQVIANVFSVLHRTNSNLTRDYQERKNRVLQQWSNLEGLNDYDLAKVYDDLADVVSVPVGQFTAHTVDELYTGLRQQWRVYGSDELVSKFMGYSLHINAIRLRLKLYQGEVVVKDVF
jgi:hypothetical protein